MIRHYNLDDVAVVVAGNLITEFGSGGIKIALTEDDWVVTQGHHGSVIRSKKPNNIAEATITVMQGSPANSLLGNLSNTDVATGLGTGVFSVTDTNGTSYCSAETSWVMKRADLNFDTEAGTVEWKIQLANVSMGHGENRRA